MGANVNEFGPRLAELRQRAGLTQADVARRSGLKVPNISRIENGPASPSLQSLKKYANALGLRVLIEFGPAD